MIPVAARKAQLLARLGDLNDRLTSIETRAERITLTAPSAKGSPGMPKPCGEVKAVRSWLRPSPTSSSKKITAPQ